MKKNPNIGIIIGIVTVLILLGVGYMMFTKQKGKVPVTNNSGELSSTPLKSDFNRDGQVDVEDADLIRKSSPCNHADACWKKVVGKTKDGDNPIYVSDLDLNHDDNVNEMDASAMTSE